MSASSSNALIHAPEQPVGILLAGGSGTRFDPSGQSNKLLATLIHGAEAGRPVAWLAAQHMKAVLARVIAVVRPDGVEAQAVARLLEDAGCEVHFSAASARGMGASLAAGVAASRHASGWVIALADMPEVQPSTIAAVVAALDHDAALAAACYRGARGHPVAFGRAYGADLARLDGDTGARALLARPGWLRIETEDAGVLRDVDTRAAL